MADEGKSYGIVGVDDDQSILSLLSAIGHQSQIPVTTYSSGTAAVLGLDDLFESLNGAPPDIVVVVSDIQMPGMDGPQTVEEIFRLYDTHYGGEYKPEVFFMSGNYTREEGDRAAKLTPHSILGKPFRFQVVNEKFKAAQKRYSDRFNADQS